MNGRINRDDGWREDQVAAENRHRPFWVTVGETVLLVWSLEGAGYLVLEKTWRL